MAQQIVYKFKATYGLLYRQPLRAAAACAARAEAERLFHRRHTPAARVRTRQEPNRRSRRSFALCLRAKTAR